MERFLSAFSKLDCKEKIKADFESVLVDRISASKSKNMVFVYCQNEAWMPSKEIQHMEQQLYKQIFRKMGFHPQICMQYPSLGKLSLSQILQIVEGDIKSELRENDYVDAIEFCEEPFECEGDSLYITCNDSFLSRRRAEQVKDWFHALFLTRFDKEISVEFHFKEYERKKKDDMETFVLKKPLEMKAAEKKPTDSKKIVKRESGKNSFRKKNIRDVDVFYGRNCEGTVVPIKEIQDEIGEVVIDGMIRSVESREIKGEKQIVTFALTDYTDTIVCKVFIKNEQITDTNFFEMVKKGNFIRVKGVASLDAYDKEIRIGSIMGMKEISDFRVGRQDNASVKRVELHAHTQMSDMDGITHVDQLVKRAHQWGHPAVAITDHGVVQAFPDANHALEGLKLEKEDPFKVIYGCEVYLVDDVSDFAVENEKGQSLRDDYVVFDLETTGFSQEKDKIIEIGAVRV
ncbi:MAG: PHP domain-containing protein, partial [Eubacterium sp.]|nr:PHP domain-containing protein [Eubacterium sp.]